MSDFKPIKTEGVVTKEVGQPRNDGTPGSALYAVPIKISEAPPTAWSELFLNAWRYPSSFTTMHRGNIARVTGDRIVLDGTTIDEVKKYHASTLKLAVEEANARYQEHLERLEQERSKDEKHAEEHRSHVEDIADQIEFD